MYGSCVLRFKTNVTKVVNMSCYERQVKSICFRIMQVPPSEFLAIYINDVDD
uniref:Uncharacterized protein n=1 Tax=Arundo donax TaxID=35708 RepID=A0A0A9CDT0_ARUDO